MWVRRDIDHKIHHLTRPSATSRADQSHTFVKLRYHRHVAIKMKLNLLGEWLSWIEECQHDQQSDFSSTFDYDDSTTTAISIPNDNCRKFIPEKKLCERDNIIIDMLNAASSSNESTTVSLCVTDPSLVDNPIVYVSNGFCQLTGYSYDEVIGRNCRFLQGPETRREDVDKIVVAVKGGVECSVNLLNYKKDGTTFRNEVSECNARGQNYFTS